MKITVVGAGKSGVSAALLAKKLGHSVLLTEKGAKEKFSSSIPLLEEYGIQYEFGGHSDGVLLNTELVITSPGVPPNSDVIRSAEIRRIPIVSEVEFASQQITNPIVAITGTNGKTTTTALTQWLFQTAGIPSIACGNIGVPMSQLIVDGLDASKWLIVETSSYQLDRISTFSPRISAMLNITPDHLSYHGTMEEYSKAKHRIYANQQLNADYIYNLDDVSTYPKNDIRPQVSAFSLKTESEFGIFADEMKLYFTENGSRIHCILRSELGLPGIHNCYNSMAAALIARKAGINVASIAKGLQTFQGVEHRLEFVRELKGVRYINDSKATNVDSTKYALTSYDAPIIWIAGGRGDNNDYDILTEEITKNVRTIIAIGEESDAIATYFSNFNVQQCATLEDAVNYATSIAKADEVVLFSPACKSFDMFSNYEERGMIFKQIVNSL
jgi:UDP-N-acetylmuramoylalanine--D-glutamate ligase